MSIAVKADPKLWEEVKDKWMRSPKGGVAGKWNARKAMLAVQEYKRRGGTYVGKRNPKNSLKKWEEEEWGYIDDDPSGRYLPKKVRDSLTPAEKRREKSLKRGKKGEWVSYSDTVDRKMREAGIYSAPKGAPKRAAPKSAPKRAAPKSAPKRAAPKGKKRAAPKGKKRAAPKGAPNSTKRKKRAA